MFQLVNSLDRTLMLSNTNVMSGNDVYTVQQKLCEQGFLTSDNITGYYNYITAQAIISYQNDKKLSPTGQVDNNTFDMLVGNKTSFTNNQNIMLNAIKTTSIPTASNVISDINNIESIKKTTASLTDYISNTAPVNPQIIIPIADNNNNNDSFFNSNNTDLLRQDDIDISITYGTNQTHKKTIKSAKFRSIGQQIDANGNPIYEIYEFIAKDLLEE